MTLAFVAGSFLAVGFFLMSLGFRGVAIPLPSRIPQGRVQVRHLGAAFPAIAAGLAVLVVTGWPVASAVVFILVLAAPDVLTSGRERKAAIERSAAIGKWCLQLHDLLERGNSTTSAIAATEANAPLPIRRHVARLAKGQRRNAEAALADFAEALSDDSADLVANLLLLDARGRGGRLADSLGQLASDIAASVESRQRIEVGRVRTRTQARAAAVTAVLGVLIFVVANRDFLHAYDSAAGQVVLAIWGAGFVGCLWLLARMDRPPQMERFSLPVATDRRRP
jgi:hypothetical protein